MPKTLERYVFVEATKCAALALVVLNAVLFTATGLRVALQLRSIDLSLLMRIVPALLVAALPVTMPIAVLAGCTLTFGRLAHDHELVAMRAVGVHLHRIVAPVIALGVLMGLVAFALGHTAIPDAVAGAHQLMFEGAGQAMARTASDDPRSISALSNVLIHCTGVDAQGALENVVVHRIDRDEGLREEIMARRGRIAFARGHARLILEQGSIAFIRSGPKAGSSAARRPGNSDVTTDRRRVLPSGPADESWFDLELRYHDRVTTWVGFERYELSIDAAALYGGRDRLGPRCLRFRELRARIDVHAELLARLEDDLARRIDAYARLEEVAGALETGAVELAAPLRHEARTLSATAATTRARATREADPERRAWLEAVADDQRDRARWSQLLATRVERRDSAYASVVRERLRGLLPGVSSNRTSVRGCAELLRTSRVEMHKRASLPLACVIVVLIGAPLGMLVRHSNRLVAFGVSAIPVFGVYYPLMVVGEYLTTAAGLAPSIAMQLPNVALGLLGLGLLWHAYRR